MQLTIVSSVKEKKTKNANQQNLGIACGLRRVGAFMGGALLLAQVAHAAPKFYSKIENGVVEAEYQHEKRFTFSREENSRLIKSILEKLPLAQSATVVSSSKPFKTPDFKNETLGFVQRNIKQVHMVAVTFARTDLLPMMYFQVKEEWKDCEPEGDYCLESLNLEVTGPSKLVRDLNDFGAFPKSLNVMNMKVSFENQSLSNVAADDAPAVVNWEMGFREVENGIEDYLRYFRSKAQKSEDRITLQHVRAAMALWASQVSKTAFTKL